VDLTLETVTCCAFIMVWLSQELACSLPSAETGFMNHLFNCLADFVSCTVFVDSADVIRILFTDIPKTFEGYFQWFA
jgi:hypothetical protein